MGNDIVDSIALIVSTASIIIASFGFYKKTKSDQFRLLLEILDRLDKSTHKLEEAEKQYQNYLIAHLNSHPKSNDKLQQIEMNKEIKDMQRGTLKSPIIVLLDVYEYFSFLVLNKEITHEDAIGFIKSRFQTHVNMAFQVIPEYASDNNIYPRIKELLKKWEDEKNCVND